jgi:hypothetical protein
MGQQIEDGSGAGYRAKVDSTNKLNTRAVIEDSSIEAAINGEQFFVTSGGINLTSASASAVLYYKNEESYPLLMDRIVFGAGVSTGGTTNSCTIAIKVNADGLSSSAGTLTAVNSNFGSAKTLTVTNSEKGAEAATVTNGTTGPTFFFPDKLTSVFESRVILEPGNSVAISVTPPASNTSLLVAATINVHKFIE